MTVPVLFVQGSAERAGAERMLFNLLKFLDRSRFTATVAFFSPGPFVDEVQALGVTVEEFGPAARVRDFTGWRKTAGQIVEAVDRCDARLVLGNGERMSIFVSRAAKRRDIPSVAWLHDAPGARGVSGRATQWLLARTSPTAVVTCSRWLAEDFNRRLGLGAICIQNGLDLPALPGRSDAVALIKQAQGWPADAVVIGYFGRLERWKGVDVFVKAAGRAAQAHSELRFLVVGDTLYGRDADFGSELRSLVGANGLGEKLLFTGYRADSMELMSGVDVVTHCSLEADPFPTVVLEGMALGKAVVATTTRGPEEALTHAETGWLIPPNDADRLAETIVTLVTQPELRQALGDRARAQAHSRFAASRMSLEFQNLFRGLVGAADLPFSGPTRQEAPS